MNSVNKILELVSRRIGDMGLVTLMAMVLLVVVDVVIRRLFNSPLSFSFELIEVFLVVCVFFALTYTTSLQRHISVNVLTSRFPEAQRIIDIVTDFISMVVFALIGWQSILQAAFIRDIGKVTGILGIPYYPFLYVVAFGSIMAGILLLINIINFVIGAFKK